jgi:hypothetical protein
VFYAGMQGLGDNIYQRAALREAPGEHDLLTPWPQLYSDLPRIRCVRPDTRLRTQVKNASRPDLCWSPAPRTPLQPVNYSNPSGTMLQGLCRAFGVTPARITFDAPAFSQPPREPYIVVRPATIRTEWRADGRNPRPEYLQRAVEALRCRYRVVSVADLQPGQEWALDPLPYADQRYHAGELQLEQLLALVAGAVAVVGGVGWLVPAAVAYRVPMLLLYGGWGAVNGPQRIFDARIDTSLVQQVLPDRFCLCCDRGHPCDKTISNLDRHLERFALRLAARGQPAVAA